MINEKKVTKCQEKKC